MNFADCGGMFLSKNMAYELIVLEKRKWKTIKKRTEKKHFKIILFNKKVNVYE